jgi:uncharacterized membrane protein YfcA
MIYLILSAAACGCFAVGMITAGGAALLLIPVIHGLLGAQAVAPVITLCTMSSGLSRIFLLWQQIRWDITKWYLPGALMGAFVGARIFSELVTSENSLNALRWIIGLFLMSTLLQFKLGQKRAAFKTTIPMMAPIGFAVATASGLVGGVGPVLNPFYLNLKVHREEMVATKAFNAFFMHLTKIGTYASFGALDMHLLGFGLIMGLGAVAGNVLGRNWLQRIGEKRFRTAVVYMMAFSGAVILITG